MQRNGTYYPDGQFRYDIFSRTNKNNKYALKASEVKDSKVITTMSDSRRVGKVLSKICTKSKLAWEY